MNLRDKAKGINQEAFQDGKSLGIMASYVHSDVKEAVIKLKNYTAGCDEFHKLIDEIFGDFEETNK